jgi:hypothetical protein
MLVRWSRYWLVHPHTFSPVNLTVLKVCSWGWVQMASETCRAKMYRNKDCIQIHVHVVGISIEHIHYQDVRNHGHQILHYVYEPTVEGGRKVDLPIKKMQIKMPNNCKWDIFFCRFQRGMKASSMMVRNRKECSETLLLHIEYNPFVSNKSILAFTCLDEIVMQPEISRRCHLYGLHTHLWQVFLVVWLTLWLFIGYSCCLIWKQVGRQRGTSWCTACGFWHNFLSNI